MNFAEEMKNAAHRFLHLCKEVQAQLKKWKGAKKRHKLVICFKLNL